MKIRHKLTIGYLLVAVFISLSGFLGIFGTERIIRLLQGDDEHLRSVVLLAFKVSIHADDLETELAMYLLLGDEVFKKKYLYHSATLKNNVIDLERKVGIAQRQEIVSAIKFDLDHIEPLGQALIDAHDNDMKKRGSFEASDYTDLMTKFVTHAANVRRDGLKLADRETDFFNRQEPITAAIRAVSYAKRLQSHLLDYLLFKDPTDRKKISERYRSMLDTMSILENRLADNTTRQILDRISADIEQIGPVMRDLVEYMDSEGPAKKFVSPDGAGLIRKVSSVIDSIRDNGMELALHNVVLETGPKKQALEQARSLQYLIIGVTVVPVMLAFFLGYLANKRSIELVVSEAMLTETNKALEIANERLTDEILEHKRVVKEKADAVVELEHALAQVKTLSGLIPICSSCKKIRDDNGYWHQVETYMRTHSEAEFSHSICPDCVRLLYPEMADQVLGSSGDAEGR
jgi:CHASE3 domain sensor protein